VENPSGKAGKVASNKAYRPAVGTTTEDDKRPPGVTVAGLRDDPQPTTKPIVGTTTNQVLGINVAPTEDTASEGKSGTGKTVEHGTGKSSEHGVPAPIKTVENGRDLLGRFAPGWAGGPGRPSKAQEQAFLDAIRASMTPGEVTAYIRKALQLAEEQNSARGLVAVLEFVRDSTSGRPVQREPEQTDALEVLLARLRTIKI
jgi:hypothetical protein